MAKYKKKPVVVDAEQWFNVTYDIDSKQGVSPEAASVSHLGVGYYRTPDLDGQDECKYCGDIMHNHGWIDTVQGGHIVCPGDWIITDSRVDEGFHGYCYPCKPDIFDATYEIVGNNVFHPDLSEDTPF